MVLAGTALGLAALTWVQGERSVHEVHITVTGASGIVGSAGSDPRGFDIDLATHLQGEPEVSVPATARTLPDWVEPSTRRGGPGAPDQVIVTMGRDASAAITADHVVLVRGDESVVLPIGGDSVVEVPSGAPEWLGRDDPHAPLVARFGRAGSIEVAARGIRVQRRGPG